MSGLAKLHGALWLGIRGFRIMKKALLIIALMLSTFGLIAQPNGDIFPDFTVTDIEGQTHNLQSYLDDGKTVIIDVFATWCGICSASTGGMEQIYNGVGQGGSGDAVVLTFERDPTTTNEASWAASNGVESPIITSATGLVADVWNVTYQPRYFVICPDGSFEMAPLGGIYNNPAPVLNLFDDCATVTSTAERLFEDVRIAGQTQEGQLFVSIPENGVRFRIMDLTGRQIQEGVLESGEQRLLMKTDRPGIYFIHLEYQGEVLTKRFFQG